MRLVGKTFWEQIEDLKSDVVIRLYSPWEEKSKLLEFVFDKIVDKFSDVVFAEMDATANEVADFHVFSYP